MVRLYGIAIARKDGNKVQKITEDIDVSSFGFFQRNSVGEFIRFTHTLVMGKFSIFRYLYIFVTQKMRQFSMFFRKIFVLVI